MTLVFCALPTLSFAQWERTSADPFKVWRNEVWVFGLSCVSEGGVTVPTENIDWRYSADVTGADSSWNSLPWSEACQELKWTPNGQWSYTFTAGGVHIDNMQTYSHFVRWKEWKQMRQEDLPGAGTGDAVPVEYWGCKDVVVRRPNGEIVEEKLRQTVGANADKFDFINYNRITNNPGGGGGQGS